MRVNRPIIAVDRSGDFNNTPIAITFCHQKTNVSINNIINEIRDIAIKNNKNLIGRKFIKAIDMENEYAQEQVMRVIEKKFNFKCAVFFPKVINYCKDLLFPIKHWNFKIEAVFYFKLLYKNIEARKIILDNDYEGNMISLINPICRLYWLFIGSSFSRKLLTFQSSRDNPNLQISDFVSGFLRSNGKLRRIYKNHVFIYRKNPKEEFENLLKKFKK